MYSQDESPNKIWIFSLNVKGYVKYAWNKT